MTLTLNDHQLVLIDTLKVNGGWMTANEIAHVLGNDYLSPQALRELDRLGDMGLLIKEVVDDNAAEGDDVRYRHSEPKTEQDKGRV